MAISSLPDTLRENYEVHEWKHATAILQHDFPQEWQDIIDVLGGFQLHQRDIEQPGGRKSTIAEAIDGAFIKRGWVEKAFHTKIVVDTREIESPTHKVDCYKNGIALEIEWNNKDPFFDRDLNNFRLLFDLRAISVGVLITRCDELQQIFDLLGRGTSYGASTTHMSKLLPRIEGGSGGGCPILVFGISRKLYKAGGSA
ncbi:MAG: restriction endonuclease [Ktedonobacterales bacterium]|nr:restriction endonuclease [Ktedonobacterales bacterium]